MNLNLGCGKNWKKEGWYRIDLIPECADYVMDFREKRAFPFKDNSVDRIFCSHVLEHLDNDSVLFLLQECRRVLKPNGIMRILVPSMEKIYAAYLLKHEEFFRLWRSIRKSSFEKMLVNTVASFRCKDYAGEKDYGGGPNIPDEKIIAKLKDCQGFNEDFVVWAVSQIPKDAYEISHVNGFDYVKLRAMLFGAGFRQVYPSAQNQSLSLEMRDPKYFDYWSHLSLHVEALA